MTLAGREFNQAFALSFSEKGKRRSRIESSVKFWNLKVEQISRKSFTCIYGSSLCMPWKFGNKLMICGLSSKCVAVTSGKTIHDGGLAEIGEKSSFRVFCGSAISILTNLPLEFLRQIGPIVATKSFFFWVFEINIYIYIYMYIFVQKLVEEKL